MWRRFVLLHVHGWFVLPPFCNVHGCSFCRRPSHNLARMVGLHGGVLSGSLTCSSSSVVVFFAPLPTNALRTVRLIAVTLVLCTCPYNLCERVVALTTSRAEKSSEKKYVSPGQNVLRRVQQASPRNQAEFAHELFAHRPTLFLVSNALSS